MVGGESVRLPLGIDCDEPLLDRAALGALHGVVDPGIIAAAGRGIPSRAELPRSLLLVVLIILFEVVLIVLVIIAVIVGLSRSTVRLVGLIVPQLAIGAVLGEQFGM